MSARRVATISAPHQPVAPSVEQFRRRRSRPRRDAAVYAALIPLRLAPLAAGLTTDFFATACFCVVTIFAPWRAETVALNVLAGVGKFLFFAAARADVVSRMDVFGKQGEHSPMTAAAALGVLGAYQPSFGGVDWKLPELSLSKILNRLGAPDDLKRTRGGFHLLYTFDDQQLRIVSGPSSNGMYKMGHVVLLPRLNAA